MAYNDKVIDHYENPRNVGSMDKDADDVGTGLVGAPACGDVMKLQIRVGADGVIENGTLDLLINTPLYTGSHSDEGKWRAAATIHQIPLITTITGARAAVAAIGALRSGEWGVKALQDYHPAS